MKLVGKNDRDFEQIRKISAESFDGVERPTVENLQFHYETYDVFVDRYVAGEIRGFAIVTQGTAGHPFIWTLAVEPRWRKCGVATGLLKEIIGHYWAERKDKIELTVNVNNPAQKIYFDLGFRAQRVIPNYYGSESGIRMRRVL